MFESINKVNMNKLVINLGILLFIVNFATIELNAQCGCPGNTSTFGTIPLSELSNVNTFTGDNLFVSLFNSYSFADKNMTRDMPGVGPYKEYNSNFLNLRIGYKPSAKLLLEAETGYFFRKKLKYTFDDYVETSSGFSDVTLYGRYTFYKDPESGWDFSAGTGLKIPLSTGTVSIPQNILPSTGAYASILNFVGKKLFPSINSGLILSHRTDINFKNKYDYLYGNSFRTSLIFVNNIYENIIIGLEVRNEVRLKDYDYAKMEELKESGMSSLIVSPIIRYSYGDFVFNMFFDMPAYQYYNGDNGQLSMKNSFGISLAYSTRVNL